MPISHGSSAWLIGITLLAVFLLGAPAALAQAVLDPGTPKPPPPPPTLPTPIVAGKVPGEVQAVLGIASSCGTYRTFPRCTYREGMVRVTFINQRADWIEFRPPYAVPSAPEALRALGLPVSKPAKTRPDGTLVWTEIPGYLEVTLTPANPAAGPVFAIKWRTQ